jgi:hypothetical protein
MPGHRGVQQSGKHETLLSELQPWKASPKKALLDVVRRAGTTTRTLEKSRDGKHSQRQELLAIAPRRPQTETLETGTLKNRALTVDSKVGSNQAPMAAVEHARHTLLCGEQSGQTPELHRRK